MWTCFAWSCTLTLVTVDWHSISMMSALSSHKGWSVRTMKRKLQWVVVFLWKTSSMRWRRSVTMPQGLQRSETNSNLRARSLQMSSLHFWAYRLVITQHLSKVYTVLCKSLKPHLIGLHLCFQGARLTCHFLKLVFISIGCFFTRFQSGPCIWLFSQDCYFCLLSHLMHLSRKRHQT